MLIPPIWNHYANHHHLSQPYLRQCLIQIDRGHGRQGKRKKWAGGRHRYFTFNGTHFFQLIEGPEEKVRDIYQHICRDPRHYNLVELLCDYAPSRRFGNVGMELFDLREHDREEVLQTVMDRGTSKYQLT